MFKLFVVEIKHQYASVYDFIYFIYIYFSLQSLNLMIYYFNRRELLTTPKVKIAKTIYASVQLLLSLKEAPS